MSEPNTPRGRRTSHPWKLTPGSALPLLAWVLGKLLCKAGAPMVNLGWRLREWAAERLAD